MKGFIPMKTHGQTSHVVMQPRTAMAGGSHRAPRPNQLIWAVRGAVILTLVLGSLGAAEAGSLSHGSASHAGAHRVVSNSRHAHHVHPIHSGSGMTGPWMW